MILQIKKGDILPVFIPSVNLRVDGQVAEVVSLLGRHYSLEGQVIWSVLFAILSAVVGYVAAGYGPLWLGYASTVSAAGMIATVSGVILAATALMGPQRRSVA